MRRQENSHSLLDLNPGIFQFTEPHVDSICAVCEPPTDLDSVYEVY